MFGLLNILICYQCVLIINSHQQKAMHEDIVRYTLQREYTENPMGHNFVKHLMFRFSLDGAHISIDLYPSRNLLGENKFSRLQSFEQTRKQNELNYFCEYKGELKNIPASTASFSVCDGLSGMFFDGSSTSVFTIFDSSFIDDEGMLQIRPLNITKGCNEEKPLLNSNQDVWSESAIKVINKSRKRREVEVMPPRSFVNGWVRYVETIIVADYDLYKQFDWDKGAIASRCIAIINNVNLIMKPLDIVVVLVDVEVIESQDTLQTSSDHVLMLKYYSPWRGKLIEKGKKHDYTIFMCGSNFHGDTVGYAFIGTMCTNDQSTAVVQHYPKEVTAAEVANVIAHEMGHTLGSKHDGPFCKSTTNDTQDSCVMTQNSIKNSCWTNCTKIYIAHNIDRFSCLLNIPNLANHLPSCGNGRLDHGEQCDCDAKWENLCCNCSTCHLMSDSVCGTGQCCNLKTCRPFHAGIMCRKSVSECDLPEYCTGSVEFCPKDVYKHDGIPCDSDKGLCYHGKCGSHRLWCEHCMVPSATKPAQKYLDDLFAAGQYSGDKICDKMYCQPHLKPDLASNANHFFNNRKFNAYTRNPLVLFTNVDTDGLTCGVNQTCIDKKCLPISLPSNEVCASGCSGNGVCNNEGNCHCDAAFSPPDCRNPGFGGSIDSGYVRNPQDILNLIKLMIWIGLAIIPPFALLCCLWINIKLLWDSNVKDNCAHGFPNCSKFIENICCPCMLFLNRWLCTMGYDALHPKPSYCDDQYETMESRKTICQVDKDVKLPDAEVRTWGVASDVLFTDLITITPKNSPRTTRKIRLPADSPILRSKSVEHLPEAKTKPKYMKSISKDSGNVSDIEENRHDQHQQKFKTSMSSLISAFAKYGQHKSGTVDVKNGNQGCANKTQSSSLKPQNLRRMVVDPLFSHKNSEQMTRPDFRRSLSTDVPSSNKIQNHRPMFPPPSPLGQSSLSDPPKIHGSEQHLHFISDKFEMKAIEMGNSPSNKSLEDKNNSQMLGRHSGSVIDSQNQPSKALLPPTKKNLTVNHSKI